MFFICLIITWEIHYARAPSQTTQEEATMPKEPMTRYSADNLLNGMDKLLMESIGEDTHEGNVLIDNLCIVEEIRVDDLDAWLRANTWQLVKDGFTRLYLPKNF